MRGTRFLFLLPILLACPSLAAESFPYKVQVAGRDVTMRSGPGERYYATGQVEKDGEVEVYQRHAEGWLAIRPPEDSFSWIEASKLRMTDDPDVAKVVGEQVVAWIGSKLDGIEDHNWQVKLSVGEPVQLMSKRSLAIFRGDPQRDFYQIAPPAGEFRWIHEREVSALTKNSKQDDSPTEVQLAQFQVVTDTKEAAAAAATPRDGFVPRGTSSSPPSGDRLASLAPRPTFRPRSGSAADIESWAKNLNVELSLMAAKSPEEWEFASLRREAEVLLDESSTTLHRGKARLLLEKIQAWETLQQRRSGVEDSTGASRDKSTNTSSSARNDSAGEPRFDGRGWLLPVHSSQQASPPYALLDQEGKILTFISPSPGLNLHRYLRKEVGIFGQRSRAEFLNKPHLTADRIVDLDRHRR